MIPSWFGMNALIVTHLLEIMFECIPIDKSNELTTRIFYQPGIMKEILDGSGQRIYGFGNFNSAFDWIYHSECKHLVSFGWILYKERTHKIRTYNDSGVRFCHSEKLQAKFLSLLFC